MEHRIKGAHLDKVKVAMIVAAAIALTAFVATCITKLFGVDGSQDVAVIAALTVSYIGLCVTIGYKFHV